MRFSLFPLLKIISSSAVPLVYGRVSVVGREQLPKGGLLVVAGPHCNHMMDSVMMAYALGRQDVFFLAYSTLYEGALVAPILKRVRSPLLQARLKRIEDVLRLSFLRSLNLIPINRAKDGRDSARDRAENLALLEEAARRVVAGAVVVIYPDGGSPGGYSLDKVQAGAAQLALDIARFTAESSQRHPSPALVCAGLSYSGFLEPFGSQVVVSFGAVTPIAQLPASPSRPEARKWRKTLTESFEQWLRKLAVIAPINDSTRIEQITGVLMGLDMNDINRVRLASRVVEQAYRLPDAQRIDLFNRLDRHFDALQSGWALPGRIAPGVSEAVQKDGAIETSTSNGFKPRSVWRSPLMAASMVGLVYLGIVLNSVPLAILAKRTAKMPEFLWLRGQQFFGSAVSVFGAWYATLLLTSGIVAGLAPGLLVPFLMGTVLSAVLGYVASRRYLWANARLFRFLEPDRFAAVEAEGEELVTSVLLLAAEREQG